MIAGRGVLVVGSKNIGGFYTCTELLLDLLF
jgi:hypothetical protein